MEIYTVKFKSKFGGEFFYPNVIKLDLRSQGAEITGFDNDGFIYKTSVRHEQYTQVTIKKETMLWSK